MVTVFYSVYMLPLLAIMAGAAWFTNHFNIW
jgi:hypothetical protein